MTRKPANPLRRLKSSVTLHRNGLTIEVREVGAADSALVAQALLDAARNLVDNGYEEMLVDAGHVGAGPGIEVPEETEDDEAKSYVRRKRRIGF